MATGTRAPSTIVTVALQGQSEFTIPFEYLARKYIVLTLLGADRKVLTLNTDYRFVSKTKVTLNVIPEAKYTHIEIKRSTSASERLVDFHDGSILRAADMNLSQVQTLHVAEEARDLTADTIGVNDQGSLDARGRRIVNVGHANESNDAVNLAQLWLFDTSTANNADRAQASADKAEAAEVRANQHSTNALASATTANNASSTATQAASSASTSADTAITKAQEAVISAQSALSSENTAVTKANIATSEANRAKTEADKLGNFNALADCIETIDPNNFGIRWRGNIFSSLGIYADGALGCTGAFTAAGAGIFRGDLTVTQDVYNQRNLTVTGTSWLQGGLTQTASTGVYNKLMRLHIAASTGNLANTPGLHLGWNESNSQGESVLVNNQNGGSGGFVFRTIDQSATTERGRVTFSANGSINATAIKTTGNVEGNTIYSGNQSARMEPNGNIVAGGSVYVGGGNAYLQHDGNIVSTIYQGGNLLSELRANYAQARQSTQIVDELAKLVYELQDRVTQLEKEIASTK